jgi:hypothetical protein
MIIRDLEHLEVVAQESVIGGASSTFQQTCLDIGIINRGSSVVLAANCRRIDGSFNYTELELQDIDNIDGVLRQF